MNQRHLWAWLVLVGIVAVHLAFDMDGGWSYALAGVGGALTVFSLLRLKESR